MVHKHWHKTYGLGFAYKSLASDPDIVAGEEKWGDPDLFAKQKKTAIPRYEYEVPWYSEWDMDMQAQWHKACLGQISPKDAVKAMDAKWAELMAEYKK